MAAIGAAATAKGAAEWADIVAAEGAEGLWGEDCGEVNILEAMAAEWAAADRRSVGRRGKGDEGEDAEETREAAAMIVEAGPAWEQQQAGQPEKPGEQAEVEQLGRVGSEAGTYAQNQGRARRASRRATGAGQSGGRRARQIA